VTVDFFNTLVFSFHEFFLPSLLYLTLMDVIFYTFQISHQIALNVSKCFKIRPFQQDLEKWHKPICQIWWMFLHWY